MSIIGVSAVTVMASLTPAKTGQLGGEGIDRGGQVQKVEIAAGARGDFHRSSGRAGQENGDPWHDGAARVRDYSINSSRLLLSPCSWGRHEQHAQDRQHRKER
jgi:hypothetical protein